MRCVAGQEKTRYQTRAPFRLPVATLLLLLLLLLLLPFLVAPQVGVRYEERGRHRARETHGAYEGSLSRPHVGDTLPVPDSTRGPPGPFNCPRLAPTAARPAYQQPWKLRRKHTAGFHTCWLTVASLSHPCPAFPLMMVGGWRCETSVPPPQPRRATLGERDRAARITSLVPSRLKTAARELRWDGAAPAR
jgi:hypothetical protein